MNNGSGDYAIAFSTAETVRRTRERRERLCAIAELPNNLMSPLFQATIRSDRRGDLQFLMYGNRDDQLPRILCRSVAAGSGYVTA